MKTLIAYYSLTGNNRKMAQEIANSMGAGKAEVDFEAIKDTAERPALTKNATGADAKKISLKVMFSTGIAVFLKQGTRLKPLSKNPLDYGLLVFGTPMWMGRLPPATRAYALALRGKVKRLAFFCVDGQTNPAGNLRELESILGVKAQASLWLKADDFEQGGYGGKVKDFIKSLNA